MSILRFPGAPPPPTDDMDMTEPSLIAAPPPEPVLKVLGEFNDIVMRGDIVALGIVGVTREGSTCMNSATSRETIQTLLAGTTILEAILRQRIIKTMVSGPNDRKDEEP